jgi:Lipid A core - O-antigen ligase and related enzymes
MRIIINISFNTSDYSSNNQSSFLSLISSILIITGLGEAIWGLLQIYDVLPGFNKFFKLTGTFFNPAPYALYLAAIFPLALGTLLSDSASKPEKNKSVNSSTSFLHSLVPSFQYYLALATVVTIIVVLPFTLIRAAWLGAIVGGLVVLQYKYHYLQRIKNFLNSRGKRIIAIGLGVFFTALNISGAYYLKKESTHGKLLIWEITLGKITQKPISGYGVGRFEAEYNNWQAEYFQHHPEEINGPKSLNVGDTRYAFNEYIETFAELGAIGLFLLLVLITVFSSQKLAIEKEQAPLIKPIFNISKAALISLLCCALISFPFYSLPTLIYFFLLLAIISSLSKNLSYNFTLTPGKGSVYFIKPIFCIILLSISVFSFNTAKKRYYAYYAWDKADFLYSNENYKDACQYFASINFILQYNGSYLRYYGKTLNQNKLYSKSIAILESARHFTSDEILYCALGEAYKNLNRYSEAEAAYKQATFVAPYKFYPLYQLANFYNETGQNEKARNIAENILTKKIKIKSSAIEEIQHSMKELTGKTNESEDKQ